MRVAVSERSAFNVFQENRDAEGFYPLMLAGLMVVAGMPSNAEAGILDRLFG